MHINAYIPQHRGLLRQMENTISAIRLSRWKVIKDASSRDTFGWRMKIMDVNVFSVDRLVGWLLPGSNWWAAGPLLGRCPGSSCNSWPAAMLAWTAFIETDQLMSWGVGIGFCLTGICQYWSLKPDGYLSDMFFVHSADLCILAASSSYSLFIYFLSQLCCQVSCFLDKSA